MELPRPGGAHWAPTQETSKVPKKKEVLFTEHSHQSRSIVDLKYLNK
jgi:hypothetical protein